MRGIPPDHPDRKLIADEVHARPPQPIETPSSAVHLALLVNAADRARELAHLAALIEPGDAHSIAHVSQYTGRIGASLFKWEKHGEFSSLTLYQRPSDAELFVTAPERELPPGWLEHYPGVTILAARAEVRAAGDGVPDTALIREYFDGPLVGSELAGGAGFAWTDFVTRPDGFERFLLLDRSFTARQAGRMLQRLFEIETYRLMALLALPVVRALMPRITASEAALAELTRHLSSSTVDDESLLNELTSLAVEAQECIVSSQFRLNACRAYAELVRTRIAELREQRLPGVQPIQEFMARRFTPAVATCASAERRLRDLVERVGNMSSLLSTRVDIVREQQNHRLLASMDVRAERQFHMQQSIERLSVAAIVYYGAGLVGYIARALAASGAKLDAELAEAVAIPVIALLCFAALWRAHRETGELKTPR